MQQSFPVQRLYGPRTLYMNRPFLHLGMAYSVPQVPSVLLLSLAKQRLPVPEDEIKSTLVG